MDSGFVEGPREWPGGGIGVDERRRHRRRQNPNPTRQNRHNA